MFAYCENDPVDNVDPSGEGVVHLNLTSSTKWLYEILSDPIIHMLRMYEKENKVRFIAQNSKMPEYNASYWGDYTSYISSGCAVACVSMALSSIDIDMLPYEVIENNLKVESNNKPTYMYWSNSGKCIVGGISLDDALDNVYENPDKYAYPIVKVADKQHYILVIGKRYDGKYGVLDPIKSGGEQAWNGKAAKVIQYYIIYI